MSQGSGQNFVSLSEVEKRSKLRLLSNTKGQVLLWKKGSKERLSFRVKDFFREKDLLVTHAEPRSPQKGEEILGHFDLNGVPYLFKARVIASDNLEVSLECKLDFYKSERRINNRVMTTSQQVTAQFALPVSYEDGKVINISRKPSETGIFKSFLKLVEGQSTNDEAQTLKLRPHDVSSTGLSVFIGPAELDWFKTGQEMTGTELHFPDEVLRLPKVKIVYVVDHIGHDQRQQKRYKVGVRFDEIPASLEQKLKDKIDVLIKKSDVNLDFEEFLK